MQEGELKKERAIMLKLELNSKQSAIVAGVIILAATLYNLDPA
jgi:hypothetical protein